MLRHNAIYQLPKTITTSKGVYYINQYGTEYISIDNEKTSWVVTETVMTNLLLKHSELPFQYDDLQLIKIKFPQQISIALSPTLSCKGEFNGSNLYEIYVDANSEMQQELNNLRVKGFPIFIKGVKPATIQNQQTVIVYGLLISDYSQARYNHPSLFGLTPCQVVPYKEEIKTPKPQAESLDIPCDNYNYRFYRKTHDTFFCYITKDEEALANLSLLQEKYGKYIDRQDIETYIVLCIHNQDYQNVLAIKNQITVNHNPSNSNMETDAFLELEKELFDGFATQEPELTNKDQDPQQVKESLPQITEINEPDAAELNVGQTLLRQGVFATDPALNKALGDYLKNNTHHNDLIHRNENWQSNKKGNN